MQIHKVFALGACVLTCVAYADPEIVEQPLKLSQAGLFADISKKEIAEGNLAYSPQYPLWSDGAVKRRWLFLPPKTQIDTTNPDRWVFPVGTKLWKEFTFVHGKTKIAKRVETRLAVKVSAKSGGWNFYTYLWNAEETDADLDEYGAGKKRSFPIAERVFHDVPNRTDCMLCHEHKGDPVLGVGALQLSADRDPLAPHAESLTKDMITLETLERDGLVSHRVKKMPKIAAATPEARAALGYLHGNCGGCHSEGGKADFTKMILWHVIGGEERDQPAYVTSVNVKNVRFTEMAYRVAGADPKASAVIKRMSSPPDSGPRMPNVGTKVLDQEAIHLLTKWIEGLPKP